MAVRARPAPARRSTALPGRRREATPPMVAWMLRARRGGGRRGHAATAPGSPAFSDAAWASARSRSLAPDRSERRRRGKSDGIDAEQAARAALAELAARRRSRAAPRWAPSARSRYLRRRGEGETAALNALRAPGRRAARGGESRCAARASNGLFAPSMRLARGLRPAPWLALSPCACSPGGRACSTREAKAWRPRSTRPRRRSPRRRGRSRPHVAARLLPPQARQRLAPALGVVLMPAGFELVPVSSGSRSGTGLSRRAATGANSALPHRGDHLHTSTTSTRLTARRMSEGAPE